MNMISSPLRGEKITYTFEWQNDGRFSVIFGKEELSTSYGFYYRCDYDIETGLFLFWKQDVANQLHKADISVMDKEWMKFITIEILDSFLKEDMFYLTTVETYSK